MTNTIKSDDYLVLSPQNLNFELLLHGKTIHENIPKSIIGSIVKSSALNMHFKKEQRKRLTTKDFQVPLCATKLNYLYGNDYRVAIDLLIEKFIFRYPYSEKSCFKYALNDIARSFKLETHKLETESAKGRGIVKRLKEDNQKIPSEIKRRFRFMIKFFDNKALTIDLNSCIELIEKEYSVSNDYTSYLSQFQKVINMHNGAYSFHYNSETDGRLHNSFTFLNRKFRKYLSYQNKKLVQIDISNSIPTIFSLLLSRSINLDLKQILNNDIYIYSLMFNKISESIDNKEIELFQKISISGELYEMVSAKYIRSNISYYIDKYDGYYDGEDYHFDDEFDSRKITKRSLLSMMFSKNGTYIDMEMAFEKLFPSIFKFIETMKENQDYKLFSHLLFQIESEIILEQVARTFNRLNNGRVPIFTIHDSIYTIKEKEEVLKSFMEKRFIELFGTNIGLTVKRY